MISIQISRNWIFSSDLFFCWYEKTDSLFPPILFAVLPKNKTKQKRWLFPFYSLLGIKSSCLIWCSYKILKICICLIKVDLYEYTLANIVSFVFKKNQTQTLIVSLFYCACIQFPPAQNLLKPGLYWNLFLKHHCVYTSVIFKLFFFKL